MGTLNGNLRASARAGAIIAFAVAMFTIGCEAGSGEGGTEAVATTAEALAATVTTLAVTPASASIPVTVEQTFKATGTYSNGKTKALTTGITWSVSDPAIASIDSTGLVTAIAPGALTVQATYANGVSSTASLTVTTATLSAVAVTPTSKQLALDGVAAFKATGTFSDGTTFPLAGSIAWSSSNSGVATIDATGLAVGVAPGTVAITATSVATGLQAKAFLTVGTATLKSLAVTPNTSSVPLGGTASFVATAFYSDGSSTDLTSVATWTSSNANVASVSAGVVIPAAAGTVTITATVKAKKATAKLTVTAPTCTDSVQNGNETDVDCGGGSCAPCGDLELCSVASDCRSSECFLSTCLPVERLSFGGVIPDLDVPYLVGLNGAGLPPTSGSDTVLETGSPSSTTDACDALPPGSLVGAAALIQRGGCLFYTKVTNAQNAGAVAVLIYDNLPNELVQADLTGDPPVSIPVITIPQADGVQISGLIESFSAVATVNWLPPE